MPGDSSCSQWVEQSAREVVISHGSGCRATRSGNLIEKGLTYKKETFREREEKEVQWQIEDHWGVTVFQ